jgi:NTE family protein
MRMSAAIAALLAATALGAAAELPAQPPPPAGAAGRPKIGLVLGGGGALGISHVGVLKVLEELRIPIDYVTGTSMGSIVGGLYASGLSPDVIGNTLAAIDWGDALRDKPQREDLTFRRKQDTDRYLLGIEIGIGMDGARLPRGAASGQKLSYLLQTLTATTVTAESFDALNIPFRCVGTDIRTGEAVVLSRGNLGDSMRASMAVPGAFTPVEIQGHLLVDGGLVKNMPVDVVKEMGAEIVIAVDVVGSEAADVKVDTLPELLARSYTILKRPMEEVQLKNADYVVVPQLQGLTAGDFHRAAEFVPRGEAAARALSAKLSALSVPEAEYQAFLARQRRGARPAVKIREVRIEGNHRVDEREIRALIGSHAGATASKASVLKDVGGLVRTRRDESRENGEVPGDVATILQDINRIFGTGYFEKVAFTLEPAGDEFDLVYKVEEKPWGPNYMHFGLQLGTDFDQESSFKFLVNLTKTNLNALGGEWRNDIVLSDRWSVKSELYQPLSFRNHFFVAPSIQAKNDLIDFYRADGDTVYAEYRARSLGGTLDIGSQFGSYGEARFGVERGWIWPTVLTGELDLPEDTLSVGKWHASLTFDRLDQYTFPTKGYYLTILGTQGREYLGNEVDAKSLAGVYRQAFPYGRNLVGVNLRGGSALGSDLPVYDQFTLGGLQSFGGFAPGQLRGPYMGAGRLYYLYRIADFSPTMGKGIYAGAIADVGNTWQSASDVGTDDLRYAGTAVLGLDTIIGPIFLGFGYADGGHMSAYLSLGSNLSNL